MQQDMPHQNNLRPFHTTLPSLNYRPGLQAPYISGDYRGHNGVGVLDVGREGTRTIHASMTRIPVPHPLPARGGLVGVVDVT